MTRVALLLALLMKPAANQAVPWAFSIPVVERKADGGTLAVVMSGDGGWAAGDRGMAEVLVGSGVAVVGVDSRAYLRAGTRTPDSMARDIAALVRHYRGAWAKDSVILIGYSRGADLLPFAVTRWTDADRAPVRLLALISPSERASFEFHWEDLIRDVKRPTDLPTAPEVDRLKGLRILCMGGADESNSGCARLAPGIASQVPHAGGHQLTLESGRQVARQVLHALGLPMAPGA